MFAEDICLPYRYKYTQVIKVHVEYDSAILAEYIRVTKLILNADKTKFQVQAIEFKERRNNCSSY